MTKSYGQFSSPGFGYTNYPNNLNCIWKIETKENVSFQFHFLDTEKDYDLIVVHDNLLDGNHTFSGPLTKDLQRTGNFILALESKNCTFTFKTDVSYTMKGFNVTYSKGKSARAIKYQNNQILHV